MEMFLHCWANQKSVAGEEQSQEHTHHFFISMGLFAKDLS
jgi:hypothetical protein